MKLTGPPVLVMPQKRRINICFQTDMASDISLRHFVIMGHCIDIWVADGIEQIMSDKAQNISSGNLPLLFFGENPGTFQKMAQKLFRVRGMGRGARILFGENSG